MCKHKVSTPPRTNLFNDPRVRSIFDPSSNPNNDPRNNGTPPGSNGHGGDPRRPGGTADPRGRNGDMRTSGLTADDVRSLTAGDSNVRRAAESAMLSERQLMDYLSSRAPALASALRAQHA